MKVARLSGIRVVVFDLDDTLCSERLYAFSGFEAVAEWLRRRQVCPVDPARRMRELFDAGCRGRVFNQLLAEWRCDQAADWIPEMVTCYRTHRPTIRLYPDAEEILGLWSGTFRLSLISDGAVVMQQGKIEALGLAGHIDPIILTDVWGRDYWKPHTRAFRELELATSCSARQCVYIGDNKEKDFVAPRALGWRTICVHRPDGIYAQAQAAPDGEPEFEVDSLTDIVIRPYPEVS
jgi:putative hydrolase of the HAD superfamily